MNTQSQNTQTPRSTKMTPEAQRIAIAEACGWKRCCYPEFAGRGTKRHRHAMFSCNSRPDLWMHQPGWGGKNDHGPQSTPVAPPDYLSDLNAMHEAETHLNGVEALARYADELDKVCVLTHICPLTHWQAVIMSTATQRAEAFLQTLGLWREDVEKASKRKAQ